MRLSACVLAVLVLVPLGAAPAGSASRPAHTVIVETDMAPDDRHGAPVPAAPAGCARRGDRRRRHRRDAAVRRVRRQRALRSPPWRARRTLPSVAAGSSRSRARSRLSRRVARRRRQALGTRPTGRSPRRKPAGTGQQVLASGAHVGSGTGRRALARPTDRAGRLSRRGPGARKEDPLGDDHGWRGGRSWERPSLHRQRPRRVERLRRSTCNERRAPFRAPDHARSARRDELRARNQSSRRAAGPISDCDVRARPDQGLARRYQGSTSGTLLPRPSSSSRASAPTRRSGSSWSSKKAPRAGERSKAPKDGRCASRCPRTGRASSARSPRRCAECARHDSNVRPLPPQGSALSPELRARGKGQCSPGAGNLDAVYGVETS